MSVKICSLSVKTKKGLGLVILHALQATPERLQTTGGDGGGGALLPRAPRPHTVHGYSISLLRYMCGQAGNPPLHVPCATPHLTLGCLAMGLPAPLCCLGALGTLHSWHHRSCSPLLTPCPALPPGQLHAAEARRRDNLEPPADVPGLVIRAGMVRWESVS